MKLARYGCPFNGEVRSLVMYMRLGLKCGIGTGKCVCANDMLLWVRGVFVKNVLVCVVSEIVLDFRYCDLHHIPFFNEQ